MSPFLVYLLFQADSISDALGVIAVISGFIFIIALFVRPAAKSSMDEDDGAALAYKACSIAVWLCPFLVVAGILMPSTKTIAAMIVLPKITSPQTLDTMGKESRDIYELAKRALTKLVDDKPDQEKAK
jgi:heme/copper-type cytochrome/quinol oxidase subunit 2